MKYKAFNLPRFIALILLLTCALSLCACGTKGDSYYAIRCAHVAVPVFYKVRPGDCGYNFLEQDEYGRILFSVEGVGKAVGGTGTVLVILQKYDEQHVYYIEDYCYLMGEETEENLEKLKERNDWNKEYDDSKIRRKNAEADIFTHDTDKVLPAVYKAIGVTKEQVLDRWLYGESDESGKELYYFIIEKDGERSHALVICDAEYHISYLQFSPESYPSPEELRAFKSQNGWNYDL